MALSPGDRVQLTRGGQGKGTVLSVAEGGASAYVTLDSGSSCTFPAGELILLAAQASETKAWPPEGIETK